jgi:ketosteroid isomerase-like protein
MLRRTILSGLLLALVGWSQSGLVEEVAKTEAAWVNAVQRGDLKAIDELLSNDLVYAHSTGTVETKQQYMAKLKAGAQKYTGIDESDTKVRVYGNTGVVTTKVRMTGSTKGVPFDNKLQMTHVWVKQGNNWQLVSHQTTRLQ